ncbi:MAG: OmpA family protein [Cypionkella sp.]
MTLHKTLIIAAIAILPLAACDPSGFTQEVGSGVDEGSFGTPTMMNQMAMMGEGDATQMLGHRFASEVNTTVNFAFNSSQLTPEAMATLSRQVTWIKRFPEVKFSVYGYTDRVGSEAYNKGLGLRRARSSVAYLIGQGISGSRLQALVSYGETRPVVNTQAPEERNRRTVTGVSGFAKGYAGQLNGKYAAIIMREYVESATRVHPTNTNVKSTIGSGG